MSLKITDFADTPEALADRSAIATQLGMTPQQLGICDRGMKLFDRTTGNVVVAWKVNGQWSSVNPYA